MMTECPRDTLHSKSVAQCANMDTALPLQAEWTKLPLSGRGQAVTVRGQLKKKQATLETRPSRLRRHWRRRPQHISFAHLELQRMCARRKSAVPQVCRPLVHGNQAHRPIHGPAFTWDTRLPSVGRERQESVALHTLSEEDVIGPCRKQRHLTPTRQSPPRASP